MQTRSNEPGAGTENRRRPLFLATTLVILLLLLGGCIARGETKALTQADCQPLTEHWNADCPAWFLEEYRLHAADFTIKVTGDSKILVSFTLQDVGDVDVTIDSIHGYGGHYKVQNATLLFDGIKIPSRVPAETDVRVSGLSFESLNETAGELFYGITITYHDERNPMLAHRLILFNRCYAIVDGAIKMTSTVRTPAGDQMDCLSKQYGSSGEVSSAAMIVHEFKRGSHAFPAPEIDTFWHTVLVD